MIQASRPSKAKLGRLQGYPWPASEMVIVQSGLVPSPTETDPPAVLASTVHELLAPPLPPVMLKRKTPFTYNVATVSRSLQVSSVRATWLAAVSRGRHTQMATAGHVGLACTFLVSAGSAARFVRACSSLC